MNETPKRALSGAVYVIVLLGCISHSKESLALLFGFFLLIAVYEFCKITQINYYISIPFSGIAYFFLWDKSNDILLKTIIVAVSILISIKLLFYLFSIQKTTFKIASRYILLVGYIIIPFILTNYVALGKKGYNPKILISIIVLIWANDTFAYLVGKNFGKIKLFPSVSPKKTIEGFIGGVIFTSIASVVLSKFYIESTILYIWVVIGFIVSIFSTLGDLIQSKFKRIAGVKDSGKIMPGHGGVLDRLDSIIFVVPFINLFYSLKLFVFELEKFLTINKIKIIL